MSARLLAIALLVACDNHGSTPDWSRMITQPKLQAYGTTDLFPDHAAMRPVPAGTVTRERIADFARREGRTPEGKDLDALPIAVTRAVLERGRDRFAITCATCHGIAGDGDSAVARNMQLRRPPSLRTARTMARTAGSFYRLIVEGYGLMPSYQTLLTVDDRWAVIAYVKTLQLSWRADLEKLPPSVQSDVIARLR
jgi:hypothetical protein